MAVIDPINVSEIEKSEDAITSIECVLFLNKKPSPDETILQEQTGAEPEIHLKGTEI